MNKENNTPFKVEAVNWEELAGIGILKDELGAGGGGRGGDGAAWCCLVWTW